MKSYDFSELSFTVVDDNRNFLYIMRTTLRGLGSRSVFETISAYAVLEHMRSHDVDFLFTDLTMPEIDGIELIQLIRNDKTLSCRGLPIVCVSAYSEHAQVTAAVLAGADGFLVKPVSPADIQRQIVSQIENPLPRVKVSGYYGPDRRRNFKNTHIGADRRGDQVVVD